ncbi:MAG: hypothetical protein A2042_04000 [Candidatus Schekmanbacteria bacterium GWA2_38_11]|uniref:Uncharacterized protein n=1 Tax=Candidatus Schekmanbacteria bacterium GWA2_38_11 TaxID=1817876 RepID=A0A1F7RMT9_9BACT|nr:MAG: hypothetical protein A2042_04000 [Candidatus Schekmanbacteria bacterium GWA2_38_11]
MTDKKFIALLAAIIILAIISVGNLVYIFSIQSPKNLNQSKINVPNNINDISQDGNVNNTDNADQIIDNTAVTDVAADQAKVESKCEGKKNLLLSDITTEKIKEIGDVGIHETAKFLLCKALKTFDPAPCTLLKNVYPNQYTACIDQLYSTYLVLNNCDEKSLTRCRNDNMLDKDSCDKMCDILINKNPNMCNSMEETKKESYNFCLAVTSDNIEKCDNETNNSEIIKCRDKFYRFKYLSSKDKKFLNELSESEYENIIYSSLGGTGISCEDYFPQKLKTECTNKPNTDQNN